MMVKRWVKTAEFAKMCQVSSAAITKAVQVGRVIRSDQKRIDLTESINKRFLEEKIKENLKKVKKSKKTEKEKPSKVNSPSAEYKGPGRPSLKPNKTQSENDEESEDSSSLENILKADFEKIKLIEQIETQVLKNEIARRKYIEKKYVSIIFGRIQTVDTQEILPIADRFPAQAAALCGIKDEKTVHEIGRLLRKEIYKALQHRKRLMDDFIRDPLGDLDDFDS